MTPLGESPGPAAGTPGWLGLAGFAGEGGEDGVPGLLEGGSAGAAAGAPPGSFPDGGLGAVAACGYGSAA